MELSGSFKYLNAFFLTTAIINGKKIFYKNTFILTFSLSVFNLTEFGRLKVSPFYALFIKRVTAAIYLIFPGVLFLYKAYFYYKTK